MKKITYNLSKEFTLSLLDTLIDLGNNEATTNDEKEFMLDLISYIFDDLRIKEELE